MSTQPSEKQPTVESEAKLHEKTVQKVAQGEVLHLDNQRRQRSRRGTTNQIDTMTRRTDLKVDDRVWEKALKLAGGNWKRIQINSATEVVVLNAPRQ